MYTLTNIPMLLPTLYRDIILSDNLQLFTRTVACPTRLSPLFQFAVSRRAANIWVLLALFIAYAQFFLFPSARRHVEHLEHMLFIARRGWESYASRQEMTGVETAVR